MRIEDLRIGLGVKVSTVGVVEEINGEINSIRIRTEQGLVVAKASHVEPYEGGK